MEQVNKLSRTILESVDFKCEFNEGGCTNAFPFCGQPDVPYTHLNGCCSLCANNLGYLSQSAGPFVNPVEVKSDPRFDKKLGFYRRGKGCLLPREERSITCLAYTCRQLSPLDRISISTAINIHYAFELTRR